MKEYFEVLCRCPLFAGVKREEMNAMLTCLGGRKAVYAKGEPVFLEGTPAKSVGVVLSGGVQIVREDYYGNRSVLAAIAPGELFGEAFACAAVESLPVSVFAQTSSVILLLDCKRVLEVCPNSCQFHKNLVMNLLQGMARKNLALTQKIRCMSQKTTGEKIMAFLLDQAKLHGSAEFTIPYDRQGLADYLGVERSAMSAQIGKLKAAGLIDTKGARFRLKTDD